MSRVRGISCQETLWLEGKKDLSKEGEGRW